MSQENDKSSPEAAASEGIHTEASPFEPGYQPETLPKISVPDLADDAQGMTAEALAQIPTLTEEAPSKDLAETPVEQPEVTEVHAVEEPAAPLADSAEPTSHEVEVAAIQDTPAQADTWGEVLHARMGKLTDDIHTLNTRLDRLEERNKTKV
jgi:hypothetical protein